MYRQNNYGEKSKMTEEQNQDTNPKTQGKENINITLQQIPLIPPPAPAPSYFQDLKDYEKEDLYRRLELKKALTVNKIRSEDEDWVISKAFKEAIYWTTEPNWIVPRKIASFTVDVSNSFVTRQLTKSFSKETGTLGAGLFGDLDYNSNKESSGSTSVNATTKSYLLAEYKRPKLFLSVDWNSIQLNDDFKNKLKEALNTNELSSFAKLNYLLNEYGYFVPMKFVIGGKISTQAEVNSQISSDSQQYQSFASGFASKLNLLSNQALGVSSQSTTSSKKQSNINKSDIGDMKLEYYGGIGSVLDFNGWIASLNYYQIWQVIKYSNVVPIICFFDEELRNKAIRAFIRYSYYPDTGKPLLLNGIHYASLALDLINREKFLSKDEKSLEDNEKLVQSLSY